METWIKENPGSAIGIGLLALSMIFNGGFDSLKTQREMSLANRQLRTEAARETSANELKALELAEKATQAEQRYANGCIPIYADNGSLTVITEGDPVIDKSRNVALPDGSTVCDPLGNTAVIDNGVMGNIASTGNKEAIRKAFPDVN